MTRIMTALILSLFLLLAAVTVPAQDAPIRVSSKPFAESQILAQLMIVALEDAGIATEEVPSPGQTPALRQEMLNNRIDIYAEYTGTAYNTFLREVDWFQRDPSIVRNAALVYGVVSSTDAVANDVMWLAPAPASNAFAIAVTRQFAAENGLTTVSDFAAYVNGGGTLRLASSDTFATRPDALMAFQDVYGFELSGGQLLVITDAPIPLIQRAVGEGVNGVNAGMSYTTDGGLMTYDLVNLVDDRGAQPIFQPAPTIRGEVLRDNPEIAGILNPVFISLDEATLRTLNTQVSSEGLAPRDVALDYLTTNGFIGEGEADEGGE